MIKTGSFTYSKHILLDKLRMDELQSILAKHCDSISTFVKTIDNSSIKFESYAELMEYDNFKKMRIKKLDIYGYKSNPWNESIKLTFYAGSPRESSVDCTYTFSDTDEEAIFNSDISKFLDKAVYFHIPALIVDWTALFLVFAAVFYLGHVILPQNTISTYVAESMIATILYALFVYLILPRLFPSVSFSWGEAIIYYKRIAIVQNILFCSIILAAVVGFFVNYISNRLF